MTSGVLAPPDRTDYQQEGAYRFALNVYGLLVGQTQGGAPASLTSNDRDDAYNLTILNRGTGGHLNIPNIMRAEDAGVTIQNLTVADLTAGDATITNLEVLGTTLLDGPTTIGDNAALDTLIVNAITAMRGPVTIQNSALTTLASFVVTAGAQTITFGPAATPNLYADVQNGRTMVGSATALTSANNDKLSVIGGSAYFASATDETAIGVRYNAAATGSFFFGAGGAVTPNTPDGVFKNSAGTQIARMFTGGGMVIGNATAVVGSETLRVQGQTLLNGITTITTGGLTVTAGGATITAGGLTVTAGASTFNDDVVLGSSAADSITPNGTFVATITMSAGNISVQGGTAGQIRSGAVIVGAASLDGTEELLVNGQTRLKGATEVTTGGLLVTGGAAADTFTANGTNTVLTLSGTTQTQTTVGAAGGASALPATPVGYIKIVVGGNNRLIPFYQ